MLVLEHFLLSLFAKGAHELYTGELAKKLVEDVSKAGGIISLQDLKSYR